MKNVIYLLSGTLFFASCNQQATTGSEGKVSATRPNVEIADTTLYRPHLKALEALAKFDYQSYAQNFSDDVKFYWSNRDSTTGRQNLVDAWKSKLINADSISFGKAIRLPVKVNVSSNVKTGYWVLGWYAFTMHMKNKKNITVSVHEVVHVNKKRQIDIGSLYYDSAPILAANTRLANRTVMN
jgi:hypothetical protein